MQQNPLDKPPIPSPFDNAAAVPATPPQTANYLVMAAVAIAAGAVLWFLSGLVGMRPVGIVVFGCYALSTIVATVAVQSAGKAMGWHVRRENLPQVRRVVDMNMKGAYAMMTTVWPFLLVAIARGEAWWAIPIMIFSVPFSMWSVGVEKKFKTMSAEPDAEPDYQTLIAAWKEARFGLKKESAVR